MGTAQPPTSVPPPAALSISPGPRWDWKNLLGDQSRSSARLRLLARLGQGLRQLQDISHPRGVIRQTCICSKGISKLKDSLK